MKRWPRWAVSILACLAPALALYVVTASWPDTPDGLFHLQRVRALAEALRSGVLYPRWFPDFAFGYGHPVLNFYAPAFYYPPALLHLAGLDVITSVRIALALGYGLSAVGMAALLRRWVRPGAAALGALLYLVFPYRLYDLFVRGALPEFAAFLWLPVVALTTIRWTDSAVRAGKDAQRWDVPGLVAAVLSWAALILTHNLTALMALIGVSVLGVVFGLAALTKDRMIGVRWVAKAARAARRAVVVLVPPAVGVFLSAFYALPALAESAWVGLGAAPDLQGYTRHFASLGELIDRGVSYHYPAAAQPTVPVPIYAVAIMALALLLMLLVRERRGFLAAGAALVTACFWLTTSASACLWNATAPVLGRLQFPWRWQAMTGLALAFLFSLEMDILAKRAAEIGSQAGPMRSRQGWSIGVKILALLLGLFLVLSSSTGLRTVPAPYQAADLTATQMWAFDAEHGQIGATWTGEFLPHWVTEQRWAIGQDPSSPSQGRTGGGVPSSAQITTTGYLSERLIYEAATPAQLRFHQFYYPAWQVQVDGWPAPTRPTGDLGLLTVDLPAGRHEVTRSWGVTPAGWIGRLISVSAWAGIFGLILWGMRRRRILAAVGWGLVGIVAVAGATDLFAHSYRASAVGADFGFVRLESCIIPTARPGEMVRVTLNWLVSGPAEPVIAFVHIVAADGRVVAQDDKPLGGNYTPASRWQPGELIPGTHRVPLPEDLPPGSYTVKAGLYPPGKPASPLIPAGGNPTDPRTVIGVLEVQP